MWITSGKHSIFLFLKKLLGVCSFGDQASHSCPPIRSRNTTRSLGWTSGSPPCSCASRKPYRAKRRTCVKAAVPRDPPLLLSGTLHGPVGGRERRRGLSARNWTLTANGLFNPFSHHPLPSPPLSLRTAKLGPERAPADWL